MAFITVDDIAFQALIESQELDDRYAQITDGLSDGTKDINVNDVTGAVGSFSSLIVDTTTLVVDAVNNRVGVNVASPDEALHVVASNASNQLKLERSGSSTGAVILGGAGGEFYLTVDADGIPYQSLYSSATGVMGMGTASPQAKLHLYTGASNDNSDLQIGGNASSGLRANFEGIGSGRVAFSSLNNAGGSNNIIGFGFGAISSGLPTNNVLSIDQAGSIIIGTASAKIIPGATSLLFRNNADSATNLTIADGGDVTLRSDLIFSATSANIIPGSTSILFRNNADSATNLTITDAGDVTIRADLNVTVDAYITGNVGVGTSSPSTQLHINNDTHGANTVLTMSAEDAGGTEYDVTLTWDPDNEKLIIDEVFELQSYFQINNSISPVLPAITIGFNGLNTLSGNINDGYSSNISLYPHYSGAYTVTRHNYLTFGNDLSSGTTITDGCAFHFDAAAGTHIAVDSGSTKTSPGTVDAWPKVNLNGTVYYIPAYTSKTS